MKLINLFLIFIIGVQIPMIAKANFKETIVIDVRTPEEFDEGFVEGARNYDIFDGIFQQKISHLDKNKIYKLYCRSGNRSGQAERMMKNMGFSEVENLGSVSQAAKKLGKPIIRSR